MPPCTAKHQPEPEPAESVQQLDFFGVPVAEPSPVLEALRDLDLNSLTPLEALLKLYELQQQAGDA